VSDPVSGGASADKGLSPSIPDFDLLRPVGQGGFGQVWLARNRATGQLRAVKLILFDEPGWADPAGREITSIRRLEANLRNKHPSLLNIRHVGKTARALFYVMDLADDVSGNTGSADPGYRPATLRSRLADGPLAPNDCLRYLRDLLAALACVHEGGMVHRDVKPENCLFVGGQLKLADFGLLAEDDPEISRVGTRRYMPPDGRMDMRADVYAAGLIVYEMLAGLSAESFPRLGERGPQVVKDPVLNRLNRLMLRACQPKPDERFRDARAMLAALVAPAAEAEASRRRLGRRAAAWGACLAAVAVLVTVWLGRSHLFPDAGRRVDVNFISQPFNATIHLDGELLVRPEDTPYLTPCTVPDLPAATHHVVFKRQGYPDLVAGEIDFAATPEIDVTWYAEP
jgi:serine/threonine protein kinase